MFIEYVQFINLVLVSLKIAMYKKHAHNRYSNYCIQYVIKHQGHYHFIKLFRVYQKRKLLSFMFHCCKNIVYFTQQYIIRILG